MIIDTSALMAILLREPGHATFRRQLSRARTVGIGTPTLTEAALVLAGRTGRDPRPILGRFLQEFSVAPVPFGEAHWREAMRAFLRYGKGRHPARLNFGDCLAYATARLADQPLLCKGDDFPQTDLELGGRRG